MTISGTQTKNIPKLRFPEFSDEWRNYRVGDLFNHIGGTALEDQVINNGSHKFISIGNYTVDGKYIDNGQRINLNKKTKEKLLAKHDLVMVLNDKTTAGDLIGSTILINYDNSFIYNQRSERIISTSKMLPSYAWFVLNSSNFRKKIYAISQGGTQIYVNFPSVQKLNLTVPTTEEQGKIADFLTIVDYKISSLQKKIDLIKKYKKCMMQKIFSQQIRFKDENGKKYPGWEEKKLGEIATFFKGTGISKDDINDDGKIEVIRYGELYTRYAEKIEEVYSRTSLDPKNLVFSKSNDVIIPASGETHIDIATASCVLKENIALSGDINIIRTENNGVFLAYYLNNAKKVDIARLAQGVSVIHLYSSNLKELKLSLPCQKEQEKIVDFLTAIDDIITLEESKLEQAKRFKKSLVQQLFV